MKLISNNSTGSHLSKIEELLSNKPKSLLWLSPFLANNITSLFSSFDFSNIGKFELITTFKENDAEQLTKPFQIKAIYEFFQNNYPKVKVVIHVNNTLHGKMYFFDFDNDSKLLLSSANLTRNGLINNSEWGLLVEDREIIEQAKEEVYADIDIECLTKVQVDKACLFADQFKRDNPEFSSDPVTYDLDFLENVTGSVDISNTDPRYFLKPIGHSEEKILKENKRDFSEKYEKQHFSTKKRPKAVRRGDYLITTAIGAGSLLSLYRITGIPMWISDEEVALEPKYERWRWYIESENLSRDFGANWWNHDIQRNKAVEEFTSLNPNVPVTRAGGYTLNSLNHGNDKIELSREFGEFLAESIKNLS